MRPDRSAAQDTAPKLIVRLVLSPRLHLYATQDLTPDQLCMNERIFLAIDTYTGSCFWVLCTSVRQYWLWIPQLESRESVVARFPHPDPQNLIPCNKNRQLCEKFVMTRGGNISRGELKTHVWDPLSAWSRVSLNPGVPSVIELRLLCHFTKPLPSPVTCAGSRVSCFGTEMISLLG